MSLGDYTPQQIEEILQAFFDVAGTRQYIGARYVPIFGRGRGTSVNWDEGADAYEPLSIVYWQGDTYTSRRYVPAGIDIHNTDYWVITGRYNAQVEQYRQEVLGFDQRINENAEAIAGEVVARENAIDEALGFVGANYTPFPDSEHYPKYGTSGQVLTTLGDGDTMWQDPVTVTAEIAGPIIAEWLNDHPEATTTVEDGSITTAKIANGAVTDAKLDQSGLLWRSDSNAHDLLLDMPDSGTWVTSKAINISTGAEYESSVFDYCEMSLPTDEGVLFVYTTAWSPAADIAFYDSSDNFLRSYYKLTTDIPTTPLYCKIPEGSSYIRMTCRKGSTYQDVMRVGYSDWKSDELLDTKYATVFNYNDGTMMIEENQGVRLLNTGELVVTSGWVSTEKIPVSFGEVISAKVGNTDTVLVCYYDGSGTLVSTSASKWHSVVPKNAVTCRMGAQLDTLANIGLRKWTPEIRKLGEPFEMMYPMRIVNNTPVSDYDGFSLSWYMDLGDTSRVVATNTLPDNNVSLYFYDDTFTYISSVAVYRDSVTTTNVLSVPATARYGIFTASGNHDFNDSLSLEFLPDTVFVGPDRKYTSLLDCLMHEKTADIFIEAGTYNVVDEYKDAYGSTFWSDYQGYSGLIDPYLRGYTPMPGQKLHFMPGSTVVFDYDGDNTYVYEQFSVFNLTTDNTIDGLRCEFGDRIARYAIHDDQAVMRGDNIIENCIFTGTSYNGPVIGGGCGSNNRYFIRNCVFDSNDGYTDISYHNGLGSGAINAVTVENCIGDQGVSFLYCGDSTLVSTFIVDNCKFPSISLNPHPNAPHENVNVRLIEFCNDTSGGN